MRRRAASAAAFRSSPSSSRASAAARSSSATRARSCAISHAELLGALGRRRLERERPQPLPHLVLDVPRALDLDRDPRELELGAMPPALEAAEPRRLLEQLAAPLRARAEDLLDLALADDRVHRAAEAEVGEQLDEVDPAHVRPVHEVLALAAALQAPRDRELGVVDRPVAVAVVEEELDLRVVRRRPRGRAREEDVVGLLGAQLVRGERPGGPDDRVRHVRLARAVRADDRRRRRARTGSRQGPGTT